MFSVQKKAIDEKLVHELLTSLFKEKPLYIVRLNHKSKSKMYKAILENDIYLVVRISDDDGQINNFLREQWCSSKAREHDIPATEVLEVGSVLIPYPYMIAREYYGIPGNMYLGDKAKMMEQIGSYMKKINHIKTTGVGDRFDWSGNILTKNESWEKYIEKAFQVDEIVKIYEEANILTPENLKKLKNSAGIIKKWKFEPTLAHGRLTPQNVIVDKHGDIVRIIDWKESRSGNSMYIDLATTLNHVDTSFHELILKGYGLSQKEYEKIALDIDSLFILRQRWVIQDLIEKKDERKLKPYTKKFNEVLSKY